MAANLHTPNQAHQERAPALANWVEDVAVALVCLFAAVIIAGMLALIFII